MKHKKQQIITLTFLFIFVVVFTFLNFKSPSQSQAASLDNFRPGYIISDYQMANFSSMTESDIQGFLTSKNSCTNKDKSLYNSLIQRYPNRTWHFENGHFICLSEELFGDGEKIGEGETAAHIIWQAAQDYKINPQVLIVLLQKESSLITDSYPNNLNYRSATGYGCPDTAACSEKYYGFKNQVRNAAKLFHDVLSGGWTNYPLGENYIKYNPDSSCGGSIVNIENLATSALYRYTPYQPNSATIAAGYGTAPCGAYGNRNFYLYFNDWFGNLKMGGIDGYVITLVEGYYGISAKTNKNQRLDVSGANIENGTNVNLWSNNNSGAQEWLIKKADEDGYYYLINPNSKKYLSVANENMYNGNNVHLWNLTNSCNQKWKPYLTNDGYITFVSLCSESMTLDMSGGNTFNGNNVWIWGINNLDAQKWKLIPYYTIKNGTFRIRSSSDSNKSMDVSGANIENGTNVNLWSNNNSGAQEWSIIKDINSDYYYIMNPHSGKFLDIEGGHAYDENNVYQWQFTGECTQRWSILKAIDSKYTLISSCAINKILNVPNSGDIKDGTNIQIWDANTANEQTWAIEPILLIKNGTYRIVSSMINKSIDISGVGIENGTNIHLWDNNISGAQEWQIIRTDEGYYRFRNPNSGKYFDLSGAIAYDGNNINLWEGNNFCAQKWSFMKTSDDTFAIFSSCSNDYVVDLEGAQIHNGTNIRVWPFIINNKAHMWKLQTYTTN